MLVLDSGAVTRLAERSGRAAALIAALRAEGLWPPVVPSVVLAECLTRHGTRDAAKHRFLRECDVAESVPVALARRAAWLRARAQRLSRGCAGDRYSRARRNSPHRRSCRSERSRRVRAGRGHRADLRTTVCLARRGRLHSHMNRPRVTCARPGGWSICQRAEEAADDVALDGQADRACRSHQARRRP
jgi:hypothetical protein